MLRTADRTAALRDRCLVELQNIRISSSGKSPGVSPGSLARPLLANPDLPALFRAGQESPERPCTFCNRCAIRTTLFPLGCYEPKRFASDAEMEAQILDWSARPDVVEPSVPPT